MSPILETLANEARAYRALGHRMLMHEYVLKHGSAFDGAPFTGKRGKPKQCFQNALDYALSHQMMFYVEGFVMLPEIPLCIHHAWCSMDGKTVIDPTLKDASEDLYFGVAYPTSKAIDIVVKKGVYGLFSNANECFDLDFFRSQDPALVDDFMAFMEKRKAA